MKNYTLFFELFGKKLLYKCEVKNDDKALKKLNDFVISKIKIIKTTSVALSEEELKKRTFVGFNDIFDDMFNDMFKDIFN